MVWVDIEKPRVHQLADSSFFDALKGDIEYLHAKNYAEYQHPGTGANYTITGQLGLDIDSTNLSLTINSTGGLIAAVFYGQFSTGSAGDSIRANIAHVNSVSHLGRNLNYDYAIEVGHTTNVVGENRGWIQFFPNLAAGSHTFSVVWGTGSGLGTLNITFRPYFAVFEF